VVRGKVPYSASKQETNVEVAPTQKATSTYSTFRMIIGESNAWRQSKWVVVSGDAANVTLSALIFNARLLKEDDRVKIIEQVERYPYQLRRAIPNEFKVGESLRSLTEVNQNGLFVDISPKLVIYPASVSEADVKLRWKEIYEWGNVKSSSANPVVSANELIRMLKSPTEKELSVRRYFLDPEKYKMKVMFPGGKQILSSTFKMVFGEYPKESILVKLTNSQNTIRPGLVNLWKKIRANYSNALNPKTYQRDPSYPMVSRRWKMKLADQRDVCDQLREQLKDAQRVLEQLQIDRDNELSQLDPMYVRKILTDADLITGYDKGSLKESKDTVNDSAFEDFE